MITPVAQAPNGLRHQLLTANVQRRRGLVKKKQRRIAQKRARNDQALPLSNAEVAESGAHFSFKAFRKLGDYFSSATVHNRLVNFLQNECMSMCINV